MTPEQIKEVKTSFEKVVPIAEEAAAIFYSRLFELDPSLRPLFKTDLTSQGRKLISTMAFVVRGLDTPALIIGKVQDLGRRHITYDVKPEDYQTVGRALLDTLEKGLGDAFTHETRDSWAMAYALLSTIMIEAANESEYDQRAA